jgi:hypothetical protein
VPSGEPQGPLTAPFHPEIQTRFQDDSKDRDTRRKIEEANSESKIRMEEAEAGSQRENKKLLVRTTVGIAILVFILGTCITFGHKDPKVRELGVAVISAPITGLLGLLAGMGLK